jgi:two-component system cell cycle sensor histidine kinase/response regulator CckA
VLYRHGHKALEEQLQQAQKMESVGRLAGGVAHDFNNMLGVILGHAEIALEQVDPAQPLHAGLVEIRKAAMRSAGLTRQLLAFARKQTVAPQVLNLNETVSGMLKMLNRLMGEDIDLDWKPAAALWPIKVDPSQIDQILANLCVSARDAIAGTGGMTIETENRTLSEEDCADRAGLLAGDYMMLAVSDNGSGMDKETQSHLFEPFFTTKEFGKGTGLGLATVYGAVKQNGGFIDVYSEPCLGTTFKIYLPRLLGDAQLARIEVTSKAAADGHENILMLMTDVVMPEMNGRDLAVQILALHPRIRQLFMSGHTADVIAHHGVLDKGVHFLQKPATVRDLTAKVREVLDGET